jgi:hypothetical protein
VGLVLAEFVTYTIFWDSTAHLLFAWTSDLAGGEGACAVPSHMRALHAWPGRPLQGQAAAAGAAGPASEPSRAAARPSLQRHLGEKQKGAHAGRIDIFSWFIP